MRSAALIRSPPAGCTHPPVVTARSAGVAMRRSHSASPARSVSASTPSGSTDRPATARAQEDGPHGDALRGRRHEALTDVRGGGEDDLDVRQPRGRAPVVGDRGAHEAVGLGHVRAQHAASRGEVARQLTGPLRPVERSAAGGGREPCDEMVLEHDLPGDAVVAAVVQPHGDDVFRLEAEVGRRPVTGHHDDGRHAAELGRDRLLQQRSSLPPPTRGRTRGSRRVRRPPHDRAERRLRAGDVHVIDVRMLGQRSVDESAQLVPGGQVERLVLDVLHLRAVVLDVRVVAAQPALFAAGLGRELVVHEDRHPRLRGGDRVGVRPGSVERPLALRARDEVGSVDPPGRVPDPPGRHGAGPRAHGGRAAGRRRRRARAVRARRGIPARWTRPPRDRGLAATGCRPALGLSRPRDRLSQPPVSRGASSALVVGSAQHEDARTMTGVRPAVGLILGGGEHGGRSVWADPA
ncbi:hypothetical protein FF38_03151 [Lucilia cuprina]|uniref:Uncharacterized protein n=1 Tax=Lucilia cuprina TaxID=7375 RepID=A0A0L0C6Q5_LUCCU|nr:hypothetical protein FF38_03151 [Lucilia cuprina]